MKQYAICKLTKQKYDRFLLCLTTESIIEYLTDIENEALIADSEGILVIDQLLITGNGKNRFIACLYKYGKIDINSTKVIEPKQSCKKISLDLLKKNFPLLKNSILTDQQLYNIEQGIVF